jgi:hypothetical protein
MSQHPPYLGGKIKKHFVKCASISYNPRLFSLSGKGHLFTQEKGGSTVNLNQIVLFVSILTN